MLIRFEFFYITWESGVSFNPVKAKRGFRVSLNSVLAFGKAKLP